MKRPLCERQLLNYYLVGGDSVVRHQYLYNQVDQLNKYQCDVNQHVFEHPKNDKYHLAIRLLV